MSETWAEQKDREQRRLDGDDQVEVPRLEPYSVSHLVRDVLRHQGQVQEIAWAKLHLAEHLDDEGWQKIVAMQERAKLRLETSEERLAAHGVRPPAWEEG